MAEQTPITAVQADAFAGTRHQRPRPNRYDTAICDAAVEAILPAIEQWQDRAISDDERERLVDILSSRIGDGGYELARELERAGYEPDAELVEILDGLNTYSAYNTAVAIWLAEVGAKALLPICSAVRIPARIKEHEGVTGQIVGIDLEHGEYTICCAALGHVREGVGTRGLIFPWEEVEARNSDMLDCAGGASFDGDVARVLGGGAS